MCNAHPSDDAAAVCHRLVELRRFQQAGMVATTFAAKTRKHRVPEAAASAAVRQGCKRTPELEVIRRDAVNPSVGALGSASMPRTARRITSSPCIRLCRGDGVQGRSEVRSYACLLWPPAYGTSNSSSAWTEKCGLAWSHIGFGSHASRSVRCYARSRGFGSGVRGCLGHRGRSRCDSRGHCIVGSPIVPPVRAPASSRRSPMHFLRGPGAVTAVWADARTGCDSPGCARHGRRAQSPQG
jgi:hypothetical protein